MKKFFQVRQQQILKIIVLQHHIWKNIFFHPCVCSGINSSSWVVLLLPVVFHWAFVFATCFNLVGCLAIELGQVSIRTDLVEFGSFLFGFEVPPSCPMCTRLTQTCTWSHSSIHPAPYILLYTFLQVNSQAYNHFPHLQFQSNRHPGKLWPPR